MSKVIMVWLFLSAVFVLDPPVLAQRTLTVPDDHLTIQAAIDAAQPGDTVLIRAGRYTEALTITKSLRLVGEDRTRVGDPGAGPRGHGDTH